MYPSETAPERYADLAVHAVSLIGFGIASAILLPIAMARGDALLTAAMVIYIAAIFASICVSAAYHLLPHHHLRKTLRKWDHAAIYPLIAGTFSPLLIVAGTTSAYIIMAVVWACALVGVLFKIFGSNLDSKWSLVSYLGLGWFGLFALPDFWFVLSGIALTALVLGGLFYTVGTLFYKSKTLSFRYPIWHIFGMMGGASFFTAIWISLAG
ncbi:hemolysin III family protein [Pontixanthobacter aestiaquae]|uniref:Hemolysin n=1 Tax=Pontixanthobacter aestiaquae TaxID=1509367 RepID=A0A844Z7U0_9SPHN|nr:hemolysin III family protein [Pontixanthobacter aestiaquae]MDN3645122.1 hemolysin III family protein [Pontixanthobacter aestiaquae]MXO83878.1 hemolysin [Pontixanthobacter aestiaquae]